ncbi:MAG: hypothetical protein ACTSPE_03445 [Candidatus Thorarchaeota archaeon]
MSLSDDLVHNLEGRKTYRNFSLLTSVEGLLMALGFCYRHPDRDAVARCSICGNPICSDCAVSEPGAPVCVECSIATSVSQSSHSDTGALGPMSVMESQVAMFTVGMAGCLLSIVVIIFLGIYGFGAPAGTLSTITRSPGLGARVANVLAGLMLAGGFMGLHSRYRQQVWRSTALVTAMMRSIEPVAYVVMAGVTTPGIPIVTAMFLGPEGIIYELVVVGIIATRNQLASPERATITALACTAASAFCVLMIVNRAMRLNEWLSVLPVASLVLAMMTLFLVFASERSAASPLGVTPM